MKNVRFTGKGFTITEVLIALFIFGTIIALPTVFLWGIGRADALAATTREVVGILHEAQTDTIAGRSLDGVQPQSYGIHFESSYFVYFEGTSYNPSDSDNRRTDLPVGLSFSQIALPSNSVVFTRVTGRVLNFDPNANFVVISDSNTGETRRITVSREGGIAYE